MNKTIFTLTQVLVPLSVFLVLVTFVTVFLIRSTKELRTSPEATIIMIPRPGAMANKIFGSELKLAWKPMYNGGIGKDQVIAVADSSLRVSTGADGEWCGASSALPRGVNVAESISMAVRSSDWDHADQIMIMLSSDGEFTEYYGIDLKNYFANPGNEEWYEFVLDQSAFTAVEGAPDWDSISNIAIRVVPVSGSSTRVWVDNVRLHKMKRSSAAISYTFDDGFDSVIAAKSIMDKYDMKGTTYVIPELLGTEGYLTQDNVDQLAAAGWDIGGHGQTDLTSLTPAEIDSELARVHLYLTRHNYKGKEHYAYPNGGYNQSVQSQVMEYFSSARTIDGFAQPPERIFPQNVNAITISNDTPITEIITAVDEAKARGTWLIIVWHDLDTQTDLGYEYHPDDFAWVTEYISNEGIAVRPYSEVYEEAMATNRPKL